MGGARTDPATEVKILLLSNRNWSAERIAEECGVSERTVNRTRRRFRSQSQTGRPPSWDPQQEEDSLALLEDGASYREAARSTGVPRRTLSDRNPGHGWTYSQGGKHARFLMGLPDDLRQTLVQKNRLE